MCIYNVTPRNAPPVSGQVREAGLPSCRNGHCSFGCWSRPHALACPGSISGGQCRAKLANSSGKGPLKLAFWELCSGPQIEQGCVFGAYWWQRLPERGGSQPSQRVLSQVRCQVHWCTSSLHPHTRPQAPSLQPQD